MQCAAGQDRRLLISRMVCFLGNRTVDKSSFQARAEMAGKNSLFQRVTVDTVAVLDLTLEGLHTETGRGVIEAAVRAMRKAAELIDMRRHRGEHPRMGATDVVPFVPVKGVTMDDCVELAHRLGERLGSELPSIR